MIRRDRFIVSEERYVKALLTYTKLLKFEDGWRSGQRLKVLSFLYQRLDPAIQSPDQTPRALVKIVGEISNGGLSVDPLFKGGPQL